MVRRAELLFALAICAMARQTYAQTLRGKAVQPSDGAGVPGVLVLLVDESGSVRTRALTNRDGEYRLRAPAAGTYEVRTLRIGFHPAVFPAVALHDGADVEKRLELTNLPFRLDTMRVAARARCSAYEGQASVVAVWEQARTALGAAEVTARDRLLYAIVNREQRTLDARSRDVQQQSSAESGGFTTKPWGTVPPDSLRRFGYVYSRDDGSTSFHAPDIDALLSENFVQDHCFRLASGADSALIGIAFEPTRDREDIPEIAGTVWLDRKSAELRRMDFRYVNLDRKRERVATGENAPKGAMEFVRMMNGGWAISNWEIRAPVVRYRTRANATPYDNAPQLYVHALHMELGSLAVVTQGRDTVWLAARKP
jgi:carboxypeptidase family protein